MRIFWGLLVGCFVAAFGSAALADTYSCTVNNKAAKGWIPNNFGFSHQAGSKALPFRARFNNGYVFGPGDWTVISDTPSKLVAIFDWVVAPNESKSPILVRYRANLNKKTGKISVTAIVNTHGQKERARGRCKQTG